MTSTSNPITPDAVSPSGLAAKRPRRRRRMPRAALLLAPSFLLVSIFVYVFISYTVGVALSANWKPAKADFTTTDPIYANFDSLLNNGRFQADLRNTFVFTVFFLALSVIAGFVLAVLVHNLLWAKGFFRGLFLLPYALSFIATGVVWRWLFNPESGLNLLLRKSGVSSAYEGVTGHALQPEWTSSAVVVGDVSSLLERVIPGGQFIQVQLGIPLALFAVVLAASWQLMGFAMAMFLAGLASIPEEVREASMIDGASGHRYYRSVVIPLLRPMAITTVVILAHVAFKMFDLIYAMSGSGIGFATDMPGIFVFETMFKGLEYNIGAAASLVMLVLVTLVVVPYLARRGPEETA